MKLKKIASSIYPPSRNTSSASSRMKAKNISFVARDFTSDEARGEDTGSVSSRRLHYRVIQEVKKYPVLFILLAAAFFLRVYRLHELLGFYYDQGRDALVVWDFVYNHKPSLIGPTTGIAGIFRGGWYYWLLSPTFFVSGGDPVVPAVFLAFTTVVALYLLFKLAQEVGGKRVAYMAIIIGSFSSALIIASRWLSNPTPMFIITMILVYGLFRAIDGKQWGWILVGISLGMAMQFGSAAEIFYFPAVGLIAVVNYKKLPGVKTVLLSAFAILFAFLPQIVFDIRHQGVLSSKIAEFLGGEDTFKIPSHEAIKDRIELYIRIFFPKIMPSRPYEWMRTAAIIMVGLLGLNAKHLMENKKRLSIILLFLAPLLGMIFFHGNFGNVYDYYFTGYYLVFVLVVSLVLGNISRYVWGQVIVFVFFSIFLVDNIVQFKNYLTATTDGPEHISLHNQLKSLDWIYADLGGDCSDFNVDVYVPPVIPYAYDYLFKWYGGKKYRCLPKTDLVSKLYTLYEVDPPHPERLQAWLDRQAGIGVIEKQATFSGITVERRRRI